MTRSFDILFGVRLNKRLSKHSWGWWFETLSCPLWRKCNVVVKSSHPGNSMQTPKIGKLSNEFGLRHNSVTAYYNIEILVCCRNKYCQVYQIQNISMAEIIYDFVSGKSDYRSAPIYYLNECCNIVNWTIWNKLMWNFNRYSYISIQEIAFENIVCKMAFISSRSQYDTQRIIGLSRVTLCTTWPKYAQHNSTSPSYTQPSGTVVCWLGCV